MDHRLSVSGEAHRAWFDPFARLKLPDTPAVSYETKIAIEEACRPVVRYLDQLAWRYQEKILQH